MLGLGRNGLSKIAGRRGFSAAAVQASSTTTAPTNAPPQNVETRNRGSNNFRSNNNNFKPFTQMSNEQLKLQRKYQEHLQNNKLETLHDAVEYVEWRGTVYPQTMDKIVRLLEESADLASFSDRQLSVILSAFGSTCDTVSRKIRSSYLEKVENVLEKKKIQLGLFSRNALIECKIDNHSRIDVVEELGKFEENEIEPDSKTYAHLCEVYAKDGNTKAITDIISHMKSSGIPVAEDHATQLVYSIAKSGNDGQLSKVIETFSKSMNAVRLRCAAARAIIAREQKNDAGKGAYEVNEMLRAIPTTAKIHFLENNVYVVNVLMDLIEAGQYDAFNLLSSYLIVSNDGKTLAENHLNVPVVARSKSILSENNIAAAMTLYSHVNPTHSNEFFLREVKKQLDEQLRQVNNENFESFLKTLALAENKGFVKNLNEFLLSGSVGKDVKSFLKIFEYVKNSGELRKVLIENSDLKRPVARQLGHLLVKSKSEEEKVRYLADVATVLFSPLKEGAAKEENGFYKIVYKLASEDVKLVIPALDLVSDNFEKREFATAIIHQLLFNAHNDHVAVDKLISIIDSNKIEQLNGYRLYNLHTRLLIRKESTVPVNVIAKIIALHFPAEGTRSIYNYAGKQFATFLANESISDQKAAELVKHLEKEPRASLTSDELAEAKTLLKASPHKVALIEKLKKSQTLTRWRTSSVEQLLNELNSFKNSSNPNAVNTLRDIICQGVLQSKESRDKEFLSHILEQTAEWKKQLKETGKGNSHEKRLLESMKSLESFTLSKALKDDDFVLADRVWLERSGHLSVVDLLGYASRLFLNGEVARADEVCEDLRKSSQPIRPVTLEKVARRLNSVDGQKMNELSEYLGKQFNLSKKDVRRIVHQVKLTQLNELLTKGKLSEALQLAVDETTESGRAFGQIPLMVEAIKRNDRKILESAHTMIKNAHSLYSANVNLAYALISCDHVSQAKQLVEKQNLDIEDNILKYFITLASSSENLQVSKNLFIVFNGRASTLELNNLLENVTRLLWKQGNIEDLHQLAKEIESSSFPLQNKLRNFFENLKAKHPDIDSEL